MAVKTFRIFTLSLLLLTVVFGQTGCQTENSSSQDAGTYGGGSAAFSAAKAILTNSCASCHLYHTMSESQLVSSGAIVAGNPEASPLYYRLTGSSGGPVGAAKNMPTGGSLSVSQIATIYDWITNASP